MPRCRGPSLPGHALRSCPSHPTWGVFCRVRCADRLRSGGPRRGRSAQRTLVRLQSQRISEVKVLAGVFWHPVTEGNCVAARRGGEQPKVND